VRFDYTIAPLRARSVEGDIVTVCCEAGTICLSASPLVHAWQIRWNKTLSCSSSTRSISVSVAG
jgi:hypothetical protein